MEYEFHSDAEKEFKEQFRYYESAKPGLGADFAEEIFRNIEMACAYPDIGSPDEDGTRSLATKRFPFVIHYQVFSDTLIVFAVMHGSRQPGYWKSRMN